MSAAALSVVFEFARAEQAGDPYAFRFHPQEYLLRSAGGGFESSRLDFGESLLADLAALRRPPCDPVLLQRLGELLRRFLSPLGWAQQEQSILSACREQRQVMVTIRSAAAELYALPWELLTLKSTGQHLGELPGVLIRYEWPETLSARAYPEPRSDSGRILLAWSAAAGAVPAPEHEEALGRASRAGCFAFSAQRDVLPHVSLGSLTATLAAAQRDGPPIYVLHLLCHGTAAAGSFGLALDAEEGGQAVVDAGRLRQVLAPYAGMLRLVVLMACDGGNPGPLGNQLGSIAQTLHRAGIAAVVASRYPLSVAGSTRLSAELYERLLCDPSSLESALLRARAKLAEESVGLDWASVQLYARAADGDDTRPVVFRPYRGLTAFLPEDRRFYFGRSRDVGRIVKLLHGGARLLTIVGASGSGKSSLVLAGVVPALRSGALGTGGLWVCAVRPGAAPCQALADALTREAGTAGAAAALPPELLRRREALAEFAAGSGQGRLLLIVDQAEELFLQADRREASAFIDNLLHAVSAAGANVTAVLTLRADFLGLCLERPALAEQVRASMTLVLPMDRADLREAIVAPAERTGIAFEEGLVDALLDAILDTEPLAGGPSPSEPSARESSAVAAGSGTLPLLQFTLEQLWERRSGDTISWHTWRAIGGVRGTIARRADEVLELARQAGEQKSTRQLFERLVHLGEGTVDTRRRARREEVEAIAPGQMQAVLDRWIAARMITTDATEVTLAHEALLREWGTLRRWIDENRESLRILHALSHDARRYADSGQSEDDLWHGTPLRRALALRAQGRLLLSPQEAEFLSRSEAVTTRRQQIIEQQQQHAQDSNFAIGARPRTLAFFSLFSLATLSYFLGLWLIPKLTHPMFMAQTAALEAVTSLMLYVMYRRRTANRANRQIVALCCVALPPMFINHWLGWKLNWPTQLSQLLNFNVLFALGLTSIITIDRRLWRVSPLILAGLLAGYRWPHLIGPLFGIVTPAAAAYLMHLFRPRSATQALLPHRTTGAESASAVNADFGIIE